MRGLLNRGCQIPPFGKRLCVSLLLLLLGTGIGLGETNAADEQTQQVIKITGSVVDSETQAPLVGVTVRVTDTQIRVTTDETGAFSLELPSGTYRVQATAPFYNTYALPDFQVNASETPQPLQILLVPQVVKLDAIKMPVQLSQSSERGLLEKRMRSLRLLRQIGKKYL